MAIRVKNANKRITGEMCINACMGMEDPYGNPFEIITLDWTPRMKNAHQSKTKGFEDTFITRKHEGGLIIEYRQPGSAEWIKDMLTGRFSAQVARTPHNMKVLAHNYYDNLWTIRQPHIRDEVKKVADIIDDEAKKIIVDITTTRPETVRDPLTGKESIQQVDKIVGQQSLYEYHKKRRDSRYLAVGEPIGAVSSKNDLEEESKLLLGKRAELARMNAEIDKKMAELNEQQKVLNKRTKELSDSGALSTTYSIEYLGKESMGSVRKIAHEMGLGINIRMKKPEIIDAILNKQNTAFKPVASEEAVTE